MSTKIKIFFVLPTLLAGGAERVMSFVSQNLDKNKFDVTLIVIGMKKDSSYEISRIPVIYLDKSRIADGFFALIRRLSKQQPHIVISSISHLNAMMGLIAVLFPKIIFVGRHASILDIPPTKNAKETFFNSIFNYFRFGTKNLDYFICQSEDMKKNIMDVYDIDENKIIIINNPVTQTTILKKNNHHNNITKFITVGRLTKTKGHIRILEILSKLSYPFEYTIIGEGNQYETIVKTVKELNLENKVRYVKFTRDVFDYLADHDMFLQGSYSEGFPNALLESCMVGTPVLAFNSPGGTKEIVENGVNGFLVNSSEEFYQRLNEKKEWNFMTIRESVLKKFNKDKIMNDYEKFFLKIIN